jgi:chromosome segregation ATPase
MPRRKIPLSKAHVIVKKWFDGDSRDEIADSVGVSGSTVSSYINEFVKRAKKTSLEDCAAEYGVEEEVRLFRTLSTELSKTGSTLNEAVEGARLRAKCIELGIDMDKLKEFVGWADRLKHPRYNQKNILEVFERLLKLEAETNLPFEEIVTNLEKTEAELEERTSTKNALNEEIKNLKIETQKAREERDRTLKERDVTLQSLNQFEGLKRQLGEVGLDINDAEKLDLIFQNAREAGYELRVLVASISEVRTLTHRRDELTQEIASLDSKIKAAQKKLATTSSRLETLEKKQAEIEGSIKALADSGTKQIEKASQDSIATIKTTLDEVGKTTIDAMGKARTEGLENLKATISETKKAIDEIVTKTAQINEEIAKVEALRPLLKLAAGEGGDVDETIPAMLILLRRLKDWQNGKYSLDISLGSYISNLIESLERSLVGS